MSPKSDSEKTEKILNFDPFHQGRMNRNSYRTMSTQTTVLVVENRLVLEVTHNSPTAPHASAIGSLGPVSLDHIQCQRRLRPAKNKISVYLCVTWTRGMATALPVRRQHSNFAIPNAAHWCRALGKLAAHEPGRPPDCSVWIWSMFCHLAILFPSQFLLSPHAKSDCVAVKKENNEKCSVFWFFHRLIDMWLPDVRRAYAMDCLP